MANSSGNVLINYWYQYKGFATGYYIEKAFRDLGWNVYRVGEELPKLDFVLNIEPCDKILHFPNTPTVYIEYDSFRHQGSETAMYEQSDIVLIGSNPQDLRTFPYPANKTHWLPFAADPEIHKPFPQKKEYDIVFVGRLDGDEHYGERHRVLDVLAKHFNLLKTKTEWGIPYSQALSKGEIIFNCSASYDINMRFFEGMAIGTLLTNYVPNLWQVATPYKHFIPYYPSDDDSDLLWKVEYLLKHKRERVKIAKESRKWVVGNHTYKHRAKQIIELVNKWNLKS